VDLALAAEKIEAWEKIMGRFLSDAAPADPPDSTQDPARTRNRQLATLYRQRTRTHARTTRSFPSLKPHLEDQLPQRAIAGAGFEIRVQSRPLPDDCPFSVTRLLENFNLDCPKALPPDQNHTVSMLQRFRASLKSARAPRPPPLGQRAHSGEAAKLRRKRSLL